MNTIIATFVAASTALAAPAPATDVDAFIKFMYASERCPGVDINFDKTMEQVFDLGAVLKWDRDRTRDKIMVETRIAKFEYDQSRKQFCGKVKTIYEAYDPSYLKRVGVVD
ncbi:hypothetical protein [Agrobacterium tumefaciens]|uniref:hypothetical protein n=1 Tax=Agrobacterium tumefaciens TaxID=358 RepID=UPI001574AE11|nr:hypothetical protein [Agrobacterium tumefaciens]NTD85463.1 hypothetical protein [Agrobacterium tumefaciens]NTD90812.1 hypothetical protein [Agrobacterium tumefaciens]NTD96391.1 hypothetical protein [Agrobacterium tumefaciens]NTE15886.1 hypothetical protein [Agrobacterium tumefaciens]NTE23125.1 hypothetical protein [Agrobacterium tumefaciens]